MDINVLNEYLKEYEIVLDDNKLQAFSKYYELLTEWNSFMNLTAITEFDEVMKKHFTDSLSLVKAVSADKVNDIISGKEVTLLDVGTGAGFPAIPLKIAFPNLKVTMIDSLNKRIKFLNEVIDRLGLTGITALHGRAEDYAKPDKLRESFDIVVSRAVANLSTLSEYCLPYAKRNGYFIPYKSEEFRDSDERKNALGAIKTLGGQLEDVAEYTLPGTDYYRCLVIIKKKIPTPKQYPRKAGLPAKEPLN